MDIFVEQLVRKKEGFSFFLKKTSVILVTLIITFLLLKMGCNIPHMATLSLFILLGLGYISFSIIKNQRVEFEYSVTNNEFTIDKIIDKRKRKHVLTFDLHSVQEIGKYSSCKNKSAKVIRSCSDEDDPSTIFLSLRHATSGNVTVLISPNKKILHAIRPFLGRQVLKNDFSWD